MTGERSWLGTERTVAVGEDAMKARRFISLVMSAVICVATAVCMMPKDVKAEDPYVKVGYEDVSTGYETEKELPDSSSGSGKVTYNNGTLTLNGVTVPKAGGSTPGIGVEPHIDLTVNIVGINKITGTGSGLYQGYGSAGDYSLTLTGDGTLNVKGTQDCGIVVRKDINIGGGTISVTGGFAGLSAWNSIIITGGSLTAKGEDSGEDSYGIKARSAITITGGSVIAEATGDNGKAFNKQPSFGDSKWYKWRTSADGAFKDSQVTPYTWSASDKYVEIVPRDAVAPTITTTSLAGGTVGTAYTQTLEATGDAPITWSLESGSGTLPDGLILNADTGEISGTPSAAGTSSFTVKASNGVNPDATKQLSITVAAYKAVTGITGVPATMTAGTPLTLSGTVAPDDATNKTITWSVKDAGTTNATISDGKLSATAAGTAIVTATIQNGWTSTMAYTQSFTITVGAAPAVTYTATINNGSGSGNYEAGQNVNITANVAPTGKVFDQWEVNSGSVTIGQVGNSSTSFTMPAGAVEITATYRDEGGEYDITAGGDQSRDQNKGDSDSGVTITCSGALNDLFSILMDGNVVDNSNYSVESGSTILTFKPAYLNTLSVGRHTVTFVYNGNKTASTTLTIKGTVEDTNKQQGKVCDHEYEWVEDEAATATTDAKLVYKCTKCGHIDMRMTEANSAYLKFNQDTEKKINEASSGATVKIDTTRWNSFYRSVIDKLAARTDVTLVIEYTDAGARHQITIPAGTDLTGFIDANGYTGFDFLVSKGLGTDYWAGRLNK